GAPLQRAHRIAAGQVIGFAVLVSASAAAAAVLFEFSPAVVGLLGLVPLGIGIRGLVGMSRGHRNEAGPEAHPKDEKRRRRRRTPEEPAVGLRLEHRAVPVLLCIVGILVLVQAGTFSLL